VKLTKIVFPKKAKRFTDVLHQLYNGRQSWEKFYRYANRSKKRQKQWNIEKLGKTLQDYAVIIKMVEKASMKKREGK